MGLASVTFHHDDAMPGASDQHKPIVVGIVWTNTWLYIVGFSCLYPMLFKKKTIVF